MAHPKISNEQVIALRRLRAKGSLLKELASDFNLHMNYVCRICNFRERKRVKSKL